MLTKHCIAEKTKEKYGSFVGCNEKLTVKVHPKFQNFLQSKKYTAYILTDTAF